MALKPIERFAYQKFEPLAKKMAAKHPELDLYLISADKGLVKEVYLAKVILYSIISAVVMSVVAAVMSFILPSIFTMAMGEGGGMVGLMVAVIFWVLAIALPVVILFVMPSMVKGAAKSRGKEIDRMLPYAVNYMSAMASAEVNPAVIFRGLATQDIYGEIKTEAANVVRDMDVLGKDIITSVHTAIERSPSIKYKDFLQGIVTTITSGGSLKMYFQAKSEQYRKENRVEQKGTLETLGVMGESFVTVVVAMPLFLIIILSVMAMMGGGGDSMFLLYVIIGFMIPASQGMFVYVISGIEIA